MPLLLVKNWMGCKDGDSLGEATKTGADKVGLTCVCVLFSWRWGGMLAGLRLLESQCGGSLTVPVCFPKGGNFPLHT